MNSDEIKTVPNPILDDYEADLESRELETLEHNRFTSHPQLKRCCTPNWFLLWMALYTIVQGALITGSFTSTLGSLAQRYQLNNYKIGVLAALYEVFVVISMLFSSYYGTKIRVSKPKLFGMGLILFFIGSFIYVSPQLFRSSNYNPGSGYLDIGLCDETDKIIPTAVCQSNDTAYGLFILGVAIIAIGVSPLYSIGPVYIEQSVTSAQGPYFIGIFYAAAAVGPAVGFLIVGGFLNTWVDGPSNQPAGITTTDTEFVGEWFVGFMIFGLLALLAAIPMLLYPPYLPGTARVKWEKKKQAAKDDINNNNSNNRASLTLPLYQKVKNILTNRVFILLQIGAILQNFTIAALVAFLTKVVTSQFNITPSVAAFSVGAIIVLGAVGGSYFGGWLPKHYKLSDSQSCALNYQFSILAFLFAFVFLLGCDNVRIAGITSNYPYPQATNIPTTASSTSIYNSPQLYSTCNVGCGCNNVNYNPVCDATTGIGYFSPCLAGCSVVNYTTNIGNSNFNNELFSNCSCSYPLSTQSVSHVFDPSFTSCTPGCSQFAPYLLLLFIALFWTTANTSPYQVTTIRVIDPNYTGLGKGLAEILFRTVGTIPAPILFGNSLDGACLVFQYNCGEQGNCQLYHNSQVRSLFLQYALIPTGLSVIFYFATWIEFKKMERRRIADSSVNMPNNNNNNNTSAEELSTPKRKKDSLLANYVNPIYSDVVEVKNNNKNDNNIELESLPPPPPEEEPETDQDTQ